jgi:hypothetical protein
VSLAERLAARVDRRGPDECWPWTRGRSAGGYGQMWHDGRVQYAHRLVVIAERGPIAPGLEVRHSCDVPACCNPAHLLVGTHAENMRDMAERRRALGRGQGERGDDHWMRRTPERIPRGACASQAKLTTEQARALRAAYAAGAESQRALAARFGISQRQVGRIVRGVSYAEV